ncbi:hypothetical protein [Plantactinospora sp. KLBMP9567]|uniref:hypothetical protein n=1 Tax=Plantactinospora sp. KLBMP9567 TaxID=3085900 RepID=UPI002981BE42|nr:hypothetical protein [Plantactinospora sp. KLBMP9567]MDW5326230.1 hypothetical protein [Plantactinospora sp. KLBMP9567]
MNNTDDADSPSGRAIALADREWRAMGIVAADRIALARDLRLELAGAAADGMTPEQLLGTDVRRFARDLAVSAGVRRAPYEFRRLLLTGLAGGVPGLVLTFVLVWQWWLVPLHLLVGMDPLPNFLLRYVLSALVFVAGVLFAVRWGMRDSAEIDRTVARMALLVPPAGLLAIPVTMGFASLTRYSLSLPVLLAEAAIVGGALAGAMVLARRWALSPILGSRRPPADPPGADPPPGPDRGGPKPAGPASDPGPPRVVPG